MIAVGIIFLILAVFLIIVGALASTKRLPGNSYIGLRLQEIRKSREAWDNAHRIAGPFWMLSGVCLVFGGIVAYFALAQIEQVLPFALALAASSFLYIAVADLIPGLHRRVDAGSGVKQFLFIVLGVVVIYTSHGMAH